MNHKDIEISIIDTAIAAIQSVTGYGERLVSDTVMTGLRGVEPIELPGTMQYTAWMCYRAIREYERQKSGDETELPY